MKSKTQAYMAPLTLAIASSFVLAGCIGGSSDNGGSGDGNDDPSTGNGATADFLAASDIYDGDYGGPDGLAALDTPEAAAQAMDLTYLASRVEDVIFTLELLTMEVEDEDTPVTIDGTRTDVTPGQLTYNVESSGTDLTKTWTMEGPNGFCVEKAGTNGPTCITGSVTQEETFEFSGNEVTSGRAETVFEGLEATFRGGKVALTGVELAQFEGTDQNATALAADIAFTSDSAKDIETDIRLWWDGVVDNVSDPANFSRTITTTIATPLIGGRIETTQTDTSGNIGSFDNFNCSDGLFGPDYEDATSGRVKIVHDGSELTAELGSVSELSKCGVFTVSGGPEGNFPLLGTLFSGLQAVSASSD